MAITVSAIKRNEIQALRKRADRGNKKVLGSSPLVLDLFAGAGGLSEGFASAGCEIIAHIEMDKNACSTLRTRMVYHALKGLGKLDEYERYLKGETTLESLVERHDLMQVSDSVICAAIGEDNYKKLIGMVQSKIGSRKLDIVVGGPPCQAYSYIGRARDVARMHKDERNYLYRYYVEFLKALKPKLFVFENVPGLLTAGRGRYLDDMRSLMKKAGYGTDYRILNASDYGVPQNRKRIILVGWSKESNLRAYPDFPKVSREYLVKDFLNDLPSIAPGDDVVIKSRKKKSDLLVELEIIKPDDHIIVDHITRPHIKRDLEIYKMAVQLKGRGINLMYSSLPKRLKTHKNEKGFLDRYKVVDAEAQGSHTVVAHISKDGHFYIHPDEKQNRSLSVREAARLQTFPDNYKFEGSRGPKYKQIGNAVPPMLAKVIAKELCKYV